MDCPTVFRHGDRWYMVYVQLETEPQGYTTQLAVSDDLLHWQAKGTILARGDGDAWDKANAAGGIALANTQWGGDGTLGTHEGRYWMSYLGGAKPGYETPPLSIGMASTLDPTSAAGWERLPAPVLRPDDRDARPFETDTLFKSFIFRDAAARSERRLSCTTTPVRRAAMRPSAWPSPRICGHGGATAMGRSS